MAADPPSAQVSHLPCLPGVGETLSGLTTFRAVVSVLLRHVLPSGAQIPKDATSRNLLKALTAEVHSWDIPGSDAAYWNAVCEHSVAMAELSYHNHDFLVKLQIARFTWYMVYIDDLSNTMPTALQDFQRGLVQGQVPENPVLRHFSLHLRDMYLYWDPVVANCIVCAALEFVNGCVLESRAEIRAMAVSPLAERWPSFLRAKTGVAAAYTLMIFPQSENVDIAQFMQAVPDINVFIELSNDVLSFYKEMLAGEVANYMHNKSATTGKTVDATLDDTSREVISTYERVSSYLRGSTREAWETFVKGYITFHVTQDRYRLRELDLNVA